MNTQESTRKKQLNPEEARLTLFKAAGYLSTSLPLSRNGADKILHAMRVALAEAKREAGDE